MRKIRIFIKNANLAKSSQIKLEGNDFEYLVKVMRQKSGDVIFVFDGLNGEFRAIIATIEKRFLLLDIKEKIAELKTTPNITLAFAPTKNTKIDFVATKATELGVARFQPIITQHTIVDKINYDRFHANIKEALEQCERNDFAEILEIKKLDKFLNEDLSNKILILCDESGNGLQAKSFLEKIASKNQEIVILIGPEGGFSKEEFTKMRLLKNLHCLNLGPRILRADTAMISALTLVQEFCGDFNLKPNF
jgi:16S rRNA (uracil1498-N3)-methyltransferase